MAETFPLYTSSHAAPLLLRQRWYARYRPALEFFMAFGAGLRCANFALRLAHWHSISASFVLLLSLGLLCFGSYRLATGGRRRQTLLLDAEGLTLRQGSTEQRCEWREVTALRRTDETTASGAVKSRLCIERGSAPVITLSDDWQIPHVGLLARMSERQQIAVGKAVPVYGDEPRPHAPSSPQGA